MTTPTTLSSCSVIRIGRNPKVSAYQSLLATTSDTGTRTWRIPSIVGRASAFGRSVGFGSDVLSRLTMPKSMVCIDNDGEATEPVLRIRAWPLELVNESLWTAPG